MSRSRGGRRRWSLAFTRRRRRWHFLRLPSRSPRWCRLATRGPTPFPNKVLDETFVVANVFLTDPETAELLKQSLPGRIYIVRAEAVFGTEAHVRNMFESGRRANHRLVNLAARSPALFILAGGRCGRRLGFGVLGAIRNFFVQLVRFAFVCERKANDAVIPLEGVEEGPVLVVGKTFVQFVLPYHASCAFEIDDFEVKSRFCLITHEGYCTLIAGIIPLRRLSGVDTTNGGSDDLVAAGWDGGLHLGLVRRRDGRR